MAPLRLKLHRPPGLAGSPTHSPTLFFINLSIKTRGEGVDFCHQAYNMRLQEHACFPAIQDPLLGSRLPVLGRSCSPRLAPFNKQASGAHPHRGDKRRPRAGGGTCMASARLVC